MAEQEFLSVSWFQWLGGGVAALWMTFFGMQQRKLNQMVTRDELDDLVDNVNERFTARREAVEQRMTDQDKRMSDLDKRIDRMREDVRASEARLTNEIHNSETRLIAAFQRNHRG